MNFVLRQAGTKQLFYGDKAIYCVWPTHMNTTQTKHRNTDIALSALLNKSVDTIWQRLSCSSGTRERNSILNVLLSTHS